MVLSRGFIALLFVSCGFISSLLFDETVDARAFAAGAPFSLFLWGLAWRNYKGVASIPITCATWCAAYYSAHASFGNSRGNLWLAFLSAGAVGGIGMAVAQFVARKEWSWRGAGWLMGLSMGASLAFAPWVLAYFVGFNGGGQIWRASLLAAAFAIWQCVVGLHLCAAAEPVRDTAQREHSGGAGSAVENGL
jgi:hypothetical protein